MRTALFVCLVLVSLGAGNPATLAPQWLPEECWVGGRQYDPRLERTVKFWGTGVPAAEVFASITEQTGVGLGFSSPDDDNARICLNLYLNPKDPPTLRDLLAQIGWVMACAWVVEGEGEARRYVLLHTDIGVGVLARLEEERRAMYEEEGERAREVAEALRPQVLARLADLREAVKLSREEAVRRYRGKDDMLLFPLLREPDRTAAEILTELTDPVPEVMLRGHAPGWRWSELTGEQRAKLRLALEAYQEAVAPGGGLPSVVKPADVPDSAPMTVTVGINHGRFMVHVRSLSRHASQESGGRVQWPYLMVGIKLVEDPSRDGLERLRYALHVSRLLGEDTTEAEHALQDARAAQGGPVGGQRRATARKVEEQRPTLRPSTWQRLAELPWRKGPAPYFVGRYVLWQVQEAAAAASGLHVISDCFWQPYRMLDSQVEEPPSSLLDALRLSTFAAAPRGAVLNGGPQSFTSVPGWEWGDAGSFLRFRSRDRDFMRGAFLPESVEQSLREQFDPYTVGLRDKLALARERARRSWSPHVVIPPRLTVPLDIRETAELALQVTPLQARWGGVLTYGDPSTPEEAYHQAFRSALLRGLVGRSRRAYRIIAGLDEEAWSRLNGEGLCWGEDFIFHDSGEQRAFAGVPLREDRKGDLYRIEDPGPEPRGQGAYGGMRGGKPPPHRVLRARIGGGERAWEARLYRAAWVEARPVEHLVPAPPEYAVKPTKAETEGELPTEHADPLRSICSSNQRSR
jgi:hypothetical protein